MPKASVREDYVKLKALVPIAEHIIEAAAAAERILNLAASGDNLAARKDQLAKDVATVLAELEEAKRLRDLAVSEHDAARQKYNEDATSYAAHLNQMSADHAAELSKAEQESAAKMADEAKRHGDRLETVKRDHASYVNDISDLVIRRNALKDEIDQLVAKFR